MDAHLPLRTATLVGFAATADPPEARRFYEGILGLRLVEDGPFALVFAAGSTSLRVQKVAVVTAAAYTSLGWEVEDISAAVEALSKRGVHFERFPGLSQDEAGVWRTPGGSSVAWFRDPDGNTLSLTQHAAP
jgi:catechol 2,3-dioxygenase-like lactoylglutathione lyase family enzyme